MSETANKMSVAERREEYVKNRDALASRVLVERVSQMDNLEVIEDSGWGDDLKLGRSSYKGWQRVIKFSRELKEDEISAIKVATEDEGCPGWCDFRIKLLKNGSFELFTGSDSSG